MFKWFKNNDDSTILEPELSFHQKLLMWLYDLDVLEKKSSNILSTEVYSRLRIINDLLYIISDFIEKYDPKIEEKYTLEKTIKEYIPQTIMLFQQLPDEDQYNGSPADMMLLKQCETIEKSLRKMLEKMVNNIKDDLTIQTSFVDKRFENAI